jgi:hypothetical protein
MMETPFALRAHFVSIIWIFVYTKIFILPTPLDFSHTPLDFSHHRTYGSRITAVLKLTNSEPIEFIKHTYEPKFIKVSLPERIVHM